MEVVAPGVFVLPLELGKQSRAEGREMGNHAGFGFRVVGEGTINRRGFVKKSILSTVALQKADVAIFKYGLPRIAENQSHPFRGSG